MITKATLRLSWRVGRTRRTRASSRLAGLVGSGVDSGLAESVPLLWRKLGGPSAALAVMVGEVADRSQSQNFSPSSS